jgi:hypothetical protein
MYSLENQCCGIGWTRFETDKDIVNLPKWEYGNCPPFTNDSFRRTSVFVWRRQWCGFDFGQRRLKNYQTTTTTFWTIPYWSITIPVTLLSTWWLFSKPRRLAGKQVTDPVSESPS